jgi:poly(A) polymerase/tRNA nucleotidyltransferase (CCA-adding enzyme)
MKIELNIPKDVSRITDVLKNNGFSAYLVGGCTRDIILGIKPKDWDITTNATPEQITELFPKTFYENAFGTVTVVNEEATDESLRNVEITPFRTETKYSDFRHPDKVEFSDKLEDDLKRRDFTINAIAYDPNTYELVDLYGGVGDLKNKIIKAVGNPDERFQEDALRMLRAIRLATQLGFTINTETEESILRNSHLLKNISKERIRDEFMKIIMSDRPMEGITLAHRMDVLRFILPDLEAGLGVEQKGSHIYDVWEHSLRALQHAADRGFTENVRLAALLHDIGKPLTRRWDKNKKEWTFYGHEVVGERIARKVLTELKFPNKTIDSVTKLVRNHMFFTDVEQITLSAVRRIIRNVGPELVWELMNVRICDRIGMGRPKEDPYKLRKYQSMIEEAMRQPTSVGMLKIDGETVMRVTRETPGPKIGFILHTLLEEVLENPSLNNEEYLEKRAKELSKLDMIELKKLGEKGKDKKEAVEEEELGKIRAKHRVK